MSTAKASDDAGSQFLAKGTALQALVSLGALDEAIDQLRHRRENLPEQGTLLELLKRLGLVEASVSDLVDKRAAHLGSEHAFELEVRTIAERSRSLQERLRSSDVPSFRDQEAIASELAGLGARQAELEDGELAEMEQVEALEKELADVSAKRDRLASEIDEMRLLLDEAKGRLDAEMAVLADNRALLVEGIDPKLLAEYEALRAHLGGSGIARLIHGSCSGCHLALPATEVDQIRHALPEEIFHCEQCGRIIVG